MRSYSKFICQQCGYESISWLGKCPQCGQWNTLVETLEKPGETKSAKFSDINPISLDKVESVENKRISTGFSEFDRVLGGFGNKKGIVAGSVILIAGDPGVGKSTLLLQLALNIAKSKNDSIVLYVAGEESPQQIKSRAERIFQQKKLPSQVVVLPETNVDLISEVIEKTNPDLVIVDSIQTMEAEGLNGAAGSVGQVRETASRLHRIAKQKGIPIFIVGHVTKEGSIAGPKTVEHLVDAVLYLEGDEFRTYRLLRGVKNRFGSVSEVGVFEMKEFGMEEVDNPSKFFLSDRRTGQAGAVVVPTMSGQRPLLAEIQALTTATPFGIPRRVGNNVDFNRLQMILAVLAKRGKINLGNHDVYVNAAGGLKVLEPAADLAIALSVVSAVKNIPIQTKTVVVGEVGLLGEIRTVNLQEKRLAEAKKLGFSQFITPETAHSLEKAILMAF